MSAAETKLHASVFLTELVYTTRGIDNLLLTRVERVTTRADVDVQAVVRHGGVGLELEAAAASYIDFRVLWVNSALHNVISIYSFNFLLFAHPAQNQDA